MERVAPINFLASLPERRQGGRQASSRRPAAGGTKAEDSGRQDDVAVRGVGAFRDFPVGRDESLRVEVDGARGGLVYLAVDAMTGKVLREYSPEQALPLIEGVHDIAGIAIDTSS